MRRGVGVALAEPDLAEDVIHESDRYQLLKPVVPRNVVVAQLPQHGLALVKESAGGGVVAAESREVTQNGQDQRVHCHRHRQPVAVLPVQRQRLLKELPRPGRISVGDDDEAGLGQRQRMLNWRQVLAAGHEVVARAGQLRGVAVQPPEPPGDHDQVHGLLQRAVIHQPGHRGPQVVVLGLQPVQPRQLPWAGEVGCGRFGQGPEVGSVPAMRLHPVAALTQPVQRILPDGLQQREPRLAAPGIRPDQAAVHQRAQRVHHLPRPTGVALIRGTGTDGFGRR